MGACQPTEPQAYIHWQSGLSEVQHFNLKCNANYKVKGLILTVQTLEQLQLMKNKPSRYYKFMHDIVSLSSEVMNISLQGNSLEEEVEKLFLSETLAEGYMCHG